jgi:peroxiredoxin
MLGTREQAVDREMGEDVKIVDAELPAVARSKRSNQIIFLLALAILLHALLNQSVAGRPDLLKIGDKVPPFHLKIISGGKVSEVDFIGKPTLYFFYADWCPCSHRSIGHIKKARADFGEAGLALMGIGMQGSSSNLEEFARRYKLGFPVSVKGGDDVARSMGVRTTPTTLFVDEAGVVRSIFIGKIERYEQIADGLNSILRSSDTPVSG